MPEYIPDSTRGQDIAGAYANSGTVVGYNIDFEINLISSNNNDSTTSLCSTCIVDENGNPYTKNGSNCWIIPASSGVGGGGPYTVVNVSGVYTITDTASSNSFIIDTNEAIPSRLQDDDGDTSIVLVEAANDSIVFTIDGQEVMTLDANKLSLSGVFIDPPTGLELTPQSSVPSQATISDNTLWINSADGHLYRGSTDLESTTAVSGIFITPVISKSAGEATLLVSDLNKFVIVEPSGSEVSINLPDVGVNEVDYFVDIYNNGLVDGTLVVTGDDSMIGSTLLESQAGCSLKVTANNQWIAVGTGKILPPPYADSFSAANWSLNPSGDYEYSVLATTHNLGTNIKIVQVFNANGSMVDLSVAGINVNKTTGDVVITTASGSQFTGDLVINGCF